MPALDETREKLVSELKILVSSAEELIKATADQASVGLASLRERTREKLEEARRSLGREENALIPMAKQRAREAETYARENPWNTLGIIAVAGFILLALLMRRD